MYIRISHEEKPSVQKCVKQTQERLIIYTCIIYTNTYRLITGRYLHSVYHGLDAMLRSMYSYVYIHSFSPFKHPMKQIQILFLFQEGGSKALKGEVTCLCYHMDLKFKSKWTGCSVHALNHYFVLYVYTYIYICYIHCVSICMYIFIYLDTYVCLCVNVPTHTDTYMCIGNVLTLIHILLYKQMQFPLNNKHIYLNNNL